MVFLGRTGPFEDGAEPVTARLGQIAQADQQDTKTHGRINARYIIDMDRRDSQNKWH